MKYRDIELLTENTLLEEKLSSKHRNQIDSNQFGLPSQRRYPMPDRAHVMAAIRMFNHVEPQYEKELAKNIIKKMKQYKIPPDTVGENNRLRKYL